VLAYPDSYTGDVVSTKRGESVWPKRLERDPNEAAPPVQRTAKDVGARESLGVMNGPEWVFPSTWFGYCDK